jgi:DNA-binding CsgD family transcriptional regulator
MEQKLRAALKMTEQSRKLLKWRLVAVCVALLWSLMFLLMFVVFKNYTAHLESVFPRPLLTAFLGLSVIASVILLIFPLQFYIYAFLCCMWGIIHFMVGENLLGFAQYFLGAIFCYYQGFFRRATRQKLAAFIAFLFVVLAWHLYRKQISWEEAVLKFLEVALLVCMMFSLFLSLFYKNTFRAGDNVLYLSVQKFSKQESALLRLILSGNKYQAIAAEQHISRSSVKMRAREIYKKLGVSGLHECLDRWRNWTVEFDE